MYDPQTQTGGLPDQQYDATTAMVINWHRQPEDDPDRNARLRYRKVYPSTSDWQTADGESMEFWYREERVNRLVLTGLEPGYPMYVAANWMELLFDWPYRSEGFYSEYRLDHPNMDPDHVREGFGHGGFGKLSFGDYLLLIGLDNSQNWEAGPDMGLKDWQGNPITDRWPWFETHHSDVHQDQWLANLLEPDDGPTAGERYTHVLPVWHWGLFGYDGYYTTYDPKGMLAIGHGGWAAGWRDPGGRGGGNAGMWFVDPENGGEAFGGEQSYHMTTVELSNNGLKVSAYHPDQLPNFENGSQPTPIHRFKWNKTDENWYSLDTDSDSWIDY